jgi:hypothetical protein
VPLQGYIIIPSVLSAEAVAELNAAYEANHNRLNPGKGHEHQVKPRQPCTDRHGNTYDGMRFWSKGYRDLIDNPTMLPIITEILGDAYREKQIGGSGGSLEPPGPLLAPPGPLLTHLHTIYMAFSERLPTCLNPLAERACFCQATHGGATLTPTSRRSCARSSGSTTTTSTTAIP